MTRLNHTLASLCCALSLIGSGCRSSLYEYGEVVGAAPPDDARAPDDMATDMATDMPTDMPTDMATDLDGDMNIAPPIDIAIPLDFSSVVDLMEPPDAPLALDLSVPPDFAPDLAFLRDLAIPPDLFLAPDLALPQSGCADGTREGFANLARFPDIAACAGGFRIPGVLSATLDPACGRAAGNSGRNPGGINCNVADLCAAGWHVCTTATDVKLHSATGCMGLAAGPGLFFITRQSSTGCAVCASGQNLANPPCNSTSCAAGCAQTDSISNDVFGCGSVGDTPDVSCGVLDRFGNNLCAMLPGGWGCGNDGTAEARAVTNASGAGGGAICCRN